MAKTKTSKKQETISKNTPLKLKTDAKVTKWTPDKLLDLGFVGGAMLECLQKNDIEGAIEVIAIHLRAVNKVKAAKHADIPRSTMYNSLYKSKNPTIKTIAKLMHASTIEAKK